MRCLTLIPVTSGRGQSPFVSSIGITLASIVNAHSVTCEAGQHFRNSKPLAKEDVLAIEGFLEEIIPDGRFAVRLDNEHKIIAWTAGKMRKFRIRSVVDDRAHLEMTPHDRTKGRIVFRERTPGQAGMAKRRDNFKKIDRRGQGRGSRTICIVRTGVAAAFP